MTFDEAKECALRIFKLNQEQDPAFAILAAYGQRAFHDEREEHFLAAFIELAAMNKKTALVEPERF